MASKSSGITCLCSYMSLVLSSIINNCFLGLFLKGQHLLCFTKVLGCKFFVGKNIRLFSWIVLEIWVLASWKVLEFGVFDSWKVLETGGEKSVGTLIQFFCFCFETDDSCGVQIC
jgi:hypothetical protein